MKNKNWTKNEDLFLIENYTKYGMGICIQNLNRTRRSIEERRKKLNLKSQYNIKEKYYKENLEDIVKISKTYKECLEYLGITNFGSSYNTIKKYIKKFNIDISHFDGNTNNFNNEIPLIEILIENSKYSNTTNVKNKLYKEHIKERKCEKCGQDEDWNGEHMSLILDHINGINNDNRLENLRILCPNCNATLPTHCRGRLKVKKEKVKKEKVTYCSCGKIMDKDAKLCRECYNKNNRKVERPEISILLEEIKELGYAGTGRKYGVSDNAIRKWIK